jgi:hypothetical protein
MRQSDKIEGDAAKEKGRYLLETDAPASAQGARTTAMHLGESKSLLESNGRVALIF